MCVGSPTAGTWSSSQWRPDDEFETDTLQRSPRQNDGRVCRFVVGRHLAAVRRHLYTNGSNEARGVNAHPHDVHAAPAPPRHARGAAP
jgi:hypothetical protein